MNFGGKYSDLFAVADYCVLEVKRRHMKKWEKTVCKCVTLEGLVSMLMDTVISIAEVGVGEMTCYKFITQRNCH